MVHNITSDTLKMKKFDKTEAKSIANEMNKLLPKPPAPIPHDRSQPMRRWIVSKPTKTGQYAVMSLNWSGELIYVSV